MTELLRRPRQGAQRLSEEEPALPTRPPPPSRLSALPRKLLLAKKRSLWIALARTAALAACLVLFAFYSLRAPPPAVPQQRVAGESSDGKALAEEITHSELDEGTGMGSSQFRYTAAHEARLPYLPRPNESRVTMERFFGCLERMLAPLPARADGNVTLAAAHEVTIPLVVIPIMLEVADNRALICSIDVPVQRLVYVVNGAVEEVEVFARDVERAFASTGKVVVHRHPENVGFSGSVNHGISAATRKGGRVPFFLVVNNDVRFPPGLLAARVRHLRQHTTADDAALAEAEQEVATEDPGHGEGRLVTTSGYPAGGSGDGSNARATVRGNWSAQGGEGRVVTSPLLPARVRRLPPSEQRKVFANYTGAVFFSEQRDGSAFLLTRLAVSMTGYFDENFYPAYFEDSDYWFRMDALGFQLHTLPAHGRVLPEAIHYGNALRKLQVNTLPSTQGQEGGGGLSPSAAAAVRQVEVLFRNPPSYLYAKVKWNTYRGNSTVDWTGYSMYRRFAEPFGPWYRVPVDVWVRDEGRINVTRTYLSLGCQSRSSPSLRYRMSMVVPYALEPVFVRTVECVCGILVALVILMFLA